MRNGTDRDSIANNAASADHGLTTPKTHRAEVTRIEELIHKMIGGDYDTLVIDSEKIADEFSKAFSGKIGSKTEDGRAVLGVLMQSFEEAIHATDWRLGYGRVRTDATIPEVAANVVISAVRLLANAFAEEGLRSYRNRDHDFLEALAELAEQANGGMAQNQGFYGKLGRQVASAVLEHKLAGPRPLLAPTQADYEDIA